MRPLKEVDPVGLHRQSGIHALDNPLNTVLHRSHSETVKLDKKRTGRAVITVNIMKLNLNII